MINFYERKSIAYDRFSATTSASATDVEVLVSFPGRPNLNSCFWRLDTNATFTVDPRLNVLKTDDTFRC